MVSKWASDSEETHEQMLAKDQAGFDYFRLNVEEGLDLMKLDELRTRGQSEKRLENALALSDLPCARINARITNLLEPVQ